MNRIPKKAQRAIDAANRAREQQKSRQYERFAALPPMRFMSLHQTPRNIINMYDVFFNGEKQRLCTIADVGQGMIRRWKYGTGSVPAPGSPTEDLFGKVEIRLKTS
jgi:hypothetical protein